MRRNRATSTRPGTGRKAFTLVELLVVMFIMAIIVALVVAVGKYVMERMAIDQTRGVMQVTHEAIVAYYDEYEEYPDAGNTKKLLEELKKCDKSWDLVTKLGQDYFRGPDEHLYDGFGERIKYDKDGGLGKRPVLISGGPDRRIGGEHKEDDIRSDR